MSVQHKDVQGRRWCFTFYNEDDLSKLRENPLDALVVALEEGSEAKKEHFQGYCKFGSNRRWSWWKRTFHSEDRADAHWELANGPEWKCRRYIADVESYLRDEPGAHAKTQGRVLFDFGCEVVLDESASPTLRVIKMIVDGAKTSQIFRTHPVFYFHNCRKITDLVTHVQAWRDAGEDFKPEKYDEEPRRKRIKAAGPPDVPSDG